MQDSEYYDYKIERKQKKSPCIIENNDKNVCRRVYDVVNIMAAADVIKK